MSNSHSLLEKQLKTLHLAAVRDQYRPLAEEAAQRNWSYETYLAQLIDLETQRRTRNRRIRRIKGCQIPPAQRTG